MKSQSQAIAVKSSPIHIGPVYTHLITLVHPTKGDESLTVQTFSDRFSDVMREIQRLKSLRGLDGYEVFEILDTSSPF